MFNIGATQDLCIYRILWEGLLSIQKHFLDTLQEKFPKKKIQSRINSYGCFNEEGKPMGRFPNCIDIYFHCEGKDENKEINISFLDGYLQKPLIRFREKGSLKLEQRLFLLSTLFSEKMIEASILWLKKGMLAEAETKAA